MRDPVPGARFRRDVKLAQKRGKDMAKLREAILLLIDGSPLRSRAAGFQPYFENGFPNGVDQWISAAGTSLATIALTLAAPPAGTHTAAVAQR